MSSHKTRFGNVLAGLKIKEISARNAGTSGRLPTLGFANAARKTKASSAMNAVHRSRLISS